MVSSPLLFIYPARPCIVCRMARIPYLPTPPPIPYYSNSRRCFVALWFPCFDLVPDVPPFQRGALPLFNPIPFILLSPIWDIGLFVSLIVIRLWPIVPLVGPGSHLYLYPLSLHPSRSASCIPSVHPPPSCPYASSSHPSIPLTGSNPFSSRLCAYT